MLREGLQETEARIVVERALMDETIGGKLAERCRELLTDRNRATLLGMIGKVSEAHRPQWWEHTSAYSPHRYRSGRLWMLSSDHVARSRALFDLAAKVKAATR